MDEKSKEIYTFQPNSHKQKPYSARMESTPSINHKNHQEHKKYVVLKLKEKFFEPEEDLSFRPTINKK